MNDAKIGRITVGIEDPMFKKPVVRVDDVPEYPPPEIEQELIVDP